MKKLTKAEIISKYDRLQKVYGHPNFNSVYGGGEENSPEICLVFMNPTARNIATAKEWRGIRYQWLGTKQIWKFLTNCGLFDEKLNTTIQSLKRDEWTEDFCEKVYSEVRNQRLYITNLAKCTQEDARPLPDEIFLEYKDLLLSEIDNIRPKKIFLFGNQVSSIVLSEKISVSECRQKPFCLKVGNNTYETYAIYYPVGNGFFNAGKAIEDIKSIIEN